MYNAMRGRALSSCLAFRYLKAKSAKKNNSRVWQSSWFFYLLICSACATFMWPSSSLSSWITTNSINSDDFKCFWFIFLENIIRGDEAGFYVIGRFSRSKFIATEFSVQFLLFVLVCFTNFYGWFKKKSLPCQPIRSLLSSFIRNHWLQTVPCSVYFQMTSVQKKHARGIYDS